MLYVRFIYTVSMLLGWTWNEGYTQKIRANLISWPCELCIKTSKLNLYV